MTTFWRYISRFYAVLRCGMMHNFRAKCQHPAKKKPGSSPVFMEK
jgi:hypothetical protein